MIAVENQRQPVNEMAQFCAAEIILRVYSSDRGKLGNDGSSAYAHVFDTTGKRELGQVVLTEKEPQTIEEVQWYRSEKPTVAMSKAVVKFANTPDLASNRLYKIQDATKWKAVGRQRIDFSRKLMKI